MKEYLSSFKLGNEVKRLKELIPPNHKTAYICNALDFADGQEWQAKFTQDDVDQLTAVGLDVERFDLRNYFGKQEQLEADIRKYGVIWVSGGNVFVLRQAMKLSGFDIVLQNLAQDGSNILYGGYSAGICVLGPSLKGLELVDSTTHHPYGDQPEVIWDGLGILNYSIVPHFDSDHPESSKVAKVVKLYEETGVVHKKIKDGEVIVVE